MKVQHRASDIKLNLVGKRVFSKKTRDNNHGDFDENLKCSRFEGEQCPLRQLKSELGQQIKKGVQKYSAIQDPRISRFTHSKLLVVEKNILMLTLLLIFLGMIKIEADVVYPSGQVSAQIMMIMTSITAILILIMSVRKVLKLQLEMDQKKVYIHKQNRKECKSSLMILLSDRVQLIGWIGETLAILPHPNFFFQGSLYTVNSEEYQADLFYSVNDMLSVLMLAKIYLVYRSLGSLTSYSSPRMIRLCRHHNLEYNFFFTVKCLQQDHPIIFTVVIFIITFILFAFGFRATEGNLYYLNKEVVGQTNGFQSYVNCLWYTFITMTSLGYGDYAPITTIARVLAGLLAIFGVTLNSFLVVAFTEYLRMKSEQIRSFTTLQRLKQYNKFRHESAGAMAEIIMVTQSISNLDPLIIRKLRPAFQYLKKKIDKSKVQSRRIRAILPQQNKTQLMIHEFELLKQNLKQIYLMQRKIKQKIVKFQQLSTARLSHVRQSFINEVNSILSKYKS